MATTESIARAKGLVRWHPLVDGQTTTYVVRLHLGGAPVIVGEPKTSRMAAEIQAEMIALDLAEHMDAAAREAARLAASRVRPKPYMIGGF